MVDLLTEMRTKARANGEDVVVLGRMPVRHGEALQAIYKRKDGLGARFVGSRVRISGPNPAYTLATRGTARLRGGSSAHRGTNGLRSSFK